MGRKMKLVATTKSHLTKEEKIARKKIEDKASDGLKHYKSHHQSISMRLQKQNTSVD